MAYKQNHLSKSPNILNILLPDLFAVPATKEFYHHTFMGAPFGNSKNSTVQDKRRAAKRKAVKRARRLGHS